MPQTTLTLLLNKSGKNYAAKKSIKVIVNYGLDLFSNFAMSCCPKN